jgi:hypothetical protein
MIFDFQVFLQIFSANFLWSFLHPIYLLNPYSLWITHQLGSAYPLEQIPSLPLLLK